MGSHAISSEFSFWSRNKNIERFRKETFDLLVIGGGITGAAVARDAASRGLKVALVDKNDFAFGTSSRSSKLVHGGLRYLKNRDFGLVFEALSERTTLLKNCPRTVRPFPFYFPVFRGDRPGKFLLSLGLWLYDILSLFRTPEFHESLSAEEILEKIPDLRREGLRGGFRYYDASMWDDALVLHTMRAAQDNGAAVANYVEALNPIWKDKFICGFHVRDLESPHPNAAFQIHADRVISCVGPWTDQLGHRLSPEWKRWLTPSKGIHLVFEKGKIPVPGAMVMSHPKDGRIAFVMARPEYGEGVVIVGTTDATTSDDPEKAEVQSADVNYLFDLLRKYFPELKLSESDIISTYVGVRPLMGGDMSTKSGQENSSVLQKVSREHHIDRGVGGTVLVAGGKYTTHRKMAEEIVDFTLNAWREDARYNPRVRFPTGITPSSTREAFNHSFDQEKIALSQKVALQKGVNLPDALVNRYGADALVITECAIQPDSLPSKEDPEGFPLLSAQLQYAIKHEMVVHLEDFYLRRVPLFLARRDHGEPWAYALSKMWAFELGKSEEEREKELARLKKAVSRRNYQTQAILPQN